MTPLPRPARPSSHHRSASGVAALGAVLAAVVGLSLAPPPAGACACGVAYGATVGQERALLTLDQGREQIVLSLDLAPPAGAGGRGSGAPTRRPAVVVPVPATPTVTALTEAESQVFAQLDAATAPRRDRGSNGSDGEAGAPSARPPVRVLSRRTIGGYDVTRLRATGGNALRRWLDRNGYVTPPAAAPVLQDYVDRGWAFVAVRLARPVPAATAGSARGLRPLRIEFASERLVYPLRLSGTGTRPVSVQLYVAGPHRVVAKGFDTYHSGNVADLRPALSAPVRGLLRGATYLTKLGMDRRPPSAITSDVTVRQAVSDRLFSATDDYPFESEAGFATAPLPSAADPVATYEGPGGATWLLLIPGVLVLVGLFALVLRLRARR